MSKSKTSEDSVPIISLVNNYLLHAIRNKVSDIHFEPNEENMRHNLFKGASMEELYEQALSDGMKTLRQHGIEKVVAGITSIDEVLTITEVGL